MTDPQPTVGRIVHYTSYGTPGGEYTSQCRAAVITEVPIVSEARTPDLLAEGEALRARGRVGLAVLNPAGAFFTEADFDDPDDHDIENGEHAGGTWHWPERA